jgi:uncharacterized SAM-dependent methyltransferase
MEKRFKVGDKFKVVNYPSLNGYTGTITDVGIEGDLFDYGVDLDNHETYVEFSFNDNEIDYANVKRYWKNVHWELDEEGNKTEFQYLGGFHFDTKEIAEKWAKETEPETYVCSVLIEERT